MAFKQKSGSPFQRNFGIGTPTKHSRDDWGFKHGHKYHRKDVPKDHPDYGSLDSATKMKSPVKHTGEEYKKEVKEVDGVDVRPKDVKGHDKLHRTKWDEDHNEIKKEEKKEKEKENSGLEMKSPMKQTETGKKIIKGVKNLPSKILTIVKDLKNKITNAPTEKEKKRFRDQMNKIIKESQVGAGKK